MKMNQLQKYQKQFLGEEPNSNESSPKKTPESPDYLEKQYIVPITEDSQETEALEDEVQNQSREDVSFNVDKADSPAWTNTVIDGQPLPATSSDKNFHHLNSTENQIIHWTQRTSRNHHQMLLSFIERLDMREHLCLTNDFQQQLESMILTMCCKENADLYNEIIQDLQGYGNLRQGTHVEALNVVQSQSERLVAILQRFCETKYNMNQFYELMYSILQPHDKNSLSSEKHTLNTLNAQDRSKHQSFSFEDMSLIKHMQSKESGKPKSKEKQDSIEVAPTTNQRNFFNIYDGECVTLISKQTPRESEEMNISQEQPRSPLRMDEVRFCNEMIDRLRAECQDYELTIVDQQNEINQLRQIIARKSDPKTLKNSQLSQIEKLQLESLVKRLTSDVKKINLTKDQQTLQIAEDRIVIQNLQDQLRDLKVRHAEAERRIETVTLNQVVTHELEALKHEHAKLKLNFSDIQEQCRQKEISLFTVEKSAQVMLQQAQKDAEECINYFKSLAVNVKTGQNTSQSTAGFNSPTHQSAFPNSLAPSLFKMTQVDTIRSPTSSQKTQSVPRAVARLMNQADVTFDDENFAYNKSASLRMQVCLDAMTKSFQEVFNLKAGLMSYIVQFRDSYCDQLKNFSVLSYDYIDKIECLVVQDTTLQQNLKKYEAQVEELRQVTSNQAKHIKAQSELVLLYRDQVRMISESGQKMVKRKDKERSDVIKFVTAELPLLAEGLTNTSQQVSNIQAGQQDTQQKLEALTQVHESAKKKIKITEEELDRALRFNKEQEKVIEEYKIKYDRITELIQDVWEAEVQQLSQRQFTFDKQAPGSRQEMMIQENVAMPCNRLADLRDFIKQLKEMNDYQKEECYEMLNMVNPQNEQHQLEHTETDGLTFNDGTSESDELLSIEQHVVNRGCCSDLGSDENVDNSSYEGKGISHRQRKGQIAKRSGVQSPRMPDDTSNKAKSYINNRQNPSERTLSSNRNAVFHRKPLSNTFGNHKNSRNNSADTKSKSVITSQRTPKIVSFSHQIVDQQLRTPQPNNNLQQRDELHQMLRDEIIRITREAKVQKEAIVQMKLELKSQRRQLQEYQAENDQLFNQINEANIKTNQLEEELKETEQSVEELQSIIEEREECIQMLKNQIEDFEKELGGLQQQMGNIIVVNQQVSESSSHWERQHQNVTQELAHERSLHEQKLSILNATLQDKIQMLKNKILEKETLMQETAKLLEREREFRAGVEAKKLAACDQGTETQVWVTVLENQNESLKIQLTQVKEDVKAVLDQYDKELARNKPLQKKSEKLRETNKQLIQELNQSRVDLDNLSGQMQAIGDDYDKLTQAFNEQQQQFQEQVYQASQTNDLLQQQVDTVTQLAEELQDQIFNSTQNNEELKKQLIIYETRIRELENRNSEFRVIQKEDIGKIQRQRDKIQELKTIASGGRRQNSQNFEPHSRSQIDQPNFNKIVSAGQNSKRQSIKEPGFLGQRDLSQSSSPNHKDARTTNITTYQYKDSIHGHDRDNLSDIMLDETTEVMSSSNLYKRNGQNWQQTKRATCDRPCSALTGQKHHLSSGLPPRNNVTRPMPRNSVSPNQNPFNNSLGEPFDSNAATIQDQLAQSCNCGVIGCQATTRPAHSQHQELNELKMRDFAKQFGKKKVDQILKYVEDIVKFYCKQQQDRVKQLTRNGLNQSSSRGLNQHVQEWSSNNLLDCWGTEESDIIEARAFFGKRSPAVLSNLKLLADSQHIGELSQNQIPINQATNYKEYNTQPITITSSRIQIRQDGAREEYPYQETNQSSEKKSQQQQQEFMEAYQNLAAHCQKIYMKLAQIGRSLAGICYGGCMMMGSKCSQEQRRNIDYAMSYLAHDTTILDATSGDNLQEVQRVTDNLIGCVGQIISFATQGLLKSAQSKRAPDSVQYSEDSTLKNAKCFSEVMKENEQNFSSTFGHGKHQKSQSQIVKDKLLDVENRIKQKFNHVSKLETSLEQLLTRSQAEQKKGTSSMAQFDGHQVSQQSSMFADTRTVLKLLATVKRVVSKLKIELHQDYIQLGQINVNIATTPSSSQMSQAAFDIISTEPALQQANLQRIVEENSQRETNRVKMGKIIDEMQGLTFEPSQSSERTNH